MKVYLAGEREIGEWSKHVKRRLYSYFYHGEKTGGVPSRDLLDTAALEMDLFLDSGAFTAFSKNVDISVDRYAAFINKYGHLFTCISNLDDTHKNEKLSYDNLRALESNGCRVCPVFHTREDPRWLVRYLDEGYPYIFIGGMVPETTAWLTGWLDDLFARYLCDTQGMPRVRLHGFGLTDQKLMFRYPWYSVDSSSWLMTGVFGACMFYVRGKTIKVIFSTDSPAKYSANGWHYSTLPPIMRDEVDRWLDALGVTAQQCSEHFSYRDIVNAATFQQMEERMVRTFTQKQIGLF